MPNAVNAVAASMQVDELRMRLAANNAANVLTHGFRRQFAAVQIAGTGDGYGPVVSTIADARPAALAPTGAPLDLAIEGEGWFELRRDGQAVLSRRGHFMTDAQGRLVDEAGWALQGQAGDIVVGSPSPRIDAGGTVFENDKPVGQVRLVMVPAGAPLEPVSGTLYRAGGAQPAVPGEAGRVRQGFLERSNVDSATEMVRVVETVRHFESGQRALQALDDLNDKLLRTLGSF
jgi:flagellar basal-body rod protein FlgG